MLQINETTVLTYIDIYM